MNKEVISDKQGISIIILYMVGTSSIFMTALEAEKDSWLAIIMALFMALIVAFILARIKTLFPEDDLFQIIEKCFGKFLGKGIILLYTGYLFYTGVLVLMNITQFINISSLDETPEIIIRVALMLLCVWIVKEGMEVLGRWSEFFVIPIIGFILIFICLSIPKMNIHHLFPILSVGITPMIHATHFVFAFPLGETVIFTIAISQLSVKKSYYKVYMTGVLIGGIILLVICLTNLLVLGINITSGVYFQTHLTASLIDIGGFLQRIEAVMTVVLILAGFIKLSIYLLATSMGVAKIFGRPDYRFVVTPVALLMINLSVILFDSIMEFMKWDVEIWPYFSLPFQVIFPIIILIIAEAKKKRTKNSIREQTCP